MNVRLFFVVVHDDRPEIISVFSFGDRQLLAIPTAHKGRGLFQLFPLGMKRLPLLKREHLSRIFRPILSR